MFLNIIPRDFLNLVLRNVGTRVAEIASEKKEIPKLMVPLVAAGRFSLFKNFSKMRDGSKFLNKKYLVN